MLNPNEGGGHQSTGGVPAFIGKLWHMVSDSASDDLISWGEDGTTFLIKDHNKFSGEVLPRYYKHNNMASFIRQLNMYNFHKVVLIESSSLKNQKELEFFHPNFNKDQPNLLSNIQRKIHSKDPVVFNNLLKEVKQLRVIQEIFSSKLTAMKKENAALWREHSILRQRHAKQEKIVNKVIHFLISMVQQSSVNVPRRKTPLMIKDRPILKPTHRKNYVRVTNQKIQSALYEVSNETNDDEQEEFEPALTEALLLACDNEEPECKDGNKVQEVPLLQMKNEVPLLEMKNKEPKKFEGPEQKKQKVSGKVMKTGKKRKYEETLSSSNSLQPELEEASALSPASSFAESVPSPEYILIENADRIAQILKAGDVGSSTRQGNGVYSQDVANTQQNIYQIPEVQVSGEQIPFESMGVPDENQQIKQRLDYVMVSSPTPIVTSPAMSSPPHSIATVAGTSDSYNAQMSPQSDPLLQLAKPADIHENIKNKQDAENHLDKVQSDLEILKDLLKGESISLDANMVLELFNDNPIDLNMGLAGQSSPMPRFLVDEDPSGQELISYSPSLLDLKYELPTDPEDLDAMEDGTVPDNPLNTPHIGMQSPNFPDS